MKIEIAGDTVFWTDIAITDNTSGAVVFAGPLKLESDWWTLYDTRTDYMGTVVKRWRGSRNHVAVLADALATIAKLPGGNTN